MLSGKLLISLYEHDFLFAAFMPQEKKKKEKENHARNGRGHLHFLSARFSNPDKMVLGFFCSFGIF